MSRSLKDTLGPCYDDLAEQIEARLQPVDAMEVLLVAQIVRAYGRLDRCEQAHDPSHPDIDRVRQQADKSIHRNLAELCQLQADRHLSAELSLNFPGVARAKDVLQGAVLSQRLAASRQNPKTTAQSAAPDHDITSLETKIAAVISKEQELQTANLKIRTQLRTSV